MTKDQVQDRIKILETSREQVRISLLAHEGAIQECLYWLSQMDKPSEEAKKEV